MAERTTAARLTSRHPGHARTVSALLTLVTVLLGGLVLPGSASGVGTAPGARSSAPAAERMVTAGILAQGGSATCTVPGCPPPRLVRDAGGEQHPAHPGAAASLPGRHLSQPGACSWLPSPPPGTACRLLHARAQPGRSPPSPPGT